MKIGVKKVITNFWNWEQVEPKPMSPPKTHFSASKNTNDNFTKSLLMDFFTDFWGTFCCQFWESSTSWPARRSNLDGAIFHTHVNRTGTIWRKKSESISTCCFSVFAIAALSNIMYTYYGVCLPHSVIYLFRLLVTKIYSSNFIIFVGSQMSR